MGLIELINEKLKNAMKNPSETSTRDVLRQIIAKAKLAAKEDMTRSKEDREKMTDEDLLKAIKKHIKQNEDAINIYKTSTDKLAVKNMAKEVSEMEILKQFLPAQKSYDEICDIIDEIVKRLGISDNSGKSKGMIMKELGKYKNDMDMSVAANIVTETLNNL